eukprot:Em0008g1214a
MDDRMEGTQRELFANSNIASRELFVAFNEDTHPASLFRGKCSVQSVHDIPDLAVYVANENHFFHCYGYKPESRRLTDLEENSLVPASQQAILPELIVRDSCTSSNHENEHYSSCPEESVPSQEELTWKPKLKDEDLLMYLRAARSIALHAGVYMNGYLADGCLAASSDETTQLAFDTLHKKQYDITDAIQELVKSPVISSVVGKRSWTKENALLFAKGMRQFGKNFYRIKKELLPGVEICELISYYYLWKKTNAGLSSRTTRRQRKQTHIRLGRAHQKTLPDSPPKREFMDWASEDEAEMTDEGGDKHHQGYYVCHHCFITVSPDWHHVGMNRRILCHDCRLYFQKYGCLMPLTVKREPPEFVYRDFHDNQTVADDQSVCGSITTASGRKTRNSNGSRLVPSSSRPGLRSGKNYSKSDTEEEVSDSSEESSYSLDEIRVTKPKVQARRSILDNLDETINSEAPPLKRTKRTQEGNDSDLEDSETTSGGDGGECGDLDHESKSTKSGETGESPSLSSAHSSNLDGDRSPGSSKECTEAAAAPPSSTSLPSSTSSSSTTSTTTTGNSQFIQVCKDREMACSRTDLIYAHPSIEGRRNKVTAPATPPIVSQAEATPPSTKVMITPHAPQLPVGPSGPLLGFYNPVAYDHAPFVRRDSEQEVVLLQQQWLALQQKQMEQLSAASYTPLLSHTGHIQYVPTASVLDQQQHFSFPTPEEMARSQRLQWQEQQQMVHNAAFIPVAMERQSRPDDSVPHVVHPIANMDALFQQQQQQQLALYGAAITSEALEVQRQYEAALQWIQKDPSLVQHQHIQQAILRYQQFQQQFAMMQQLAMEQQQSRMLQEMQMGRPHPHEELHTPRVRPGVIVQPK